MEGVPLGLGQKLTNKVLVSCTIPLLFCITYMYMYMYIASALCTYISIHITCRLEHQMDV